MAETSERRKLPTDRYGGHVHKLKFCADSVYVVVNKSDKGEVLEVFGYGESGIRGDLDGLCGLTSIALQYGTPLEKIVKFLRYRNYPPHGTAGQAKSISDALAIVLEEYLEKEDE